MSPRWWLLAVGVFMLYRSRQTAQRAVHDAAKTIADATAPTQPEARYDVPAGDQQFAPVNTPIYAQAPGSVGVLDQRSLADMLDEQ